MMNKLVEPLLIIFVVLLAMAASTHCTARADEHGPSEAQRHQQAREWSAQRACPKGHVPEWVDSVTVQCLRVLP